jgi:sigma-B regulation protein RsbU (phosphoserine phosphatase)
MSTPSKSAVRFRERAELLDFVLEVVAATSQTLDLDELLAAVAEVVKKVIPYELFAILLYSEKSQTLRIRYAIGHRDEVMKNLQIRLGEGITGHAAWVREAILVPDVRSDPRYLSVVDAVRTELAAPLISRGKLIGVIDLESSRVDAYSEYDRALLRVIAARVAVAIENARLYRRVERQNRTLRTLARLSQEFSSTLDLNELLSKIAEAIRALINFDAFSILLVDEARKALCHRYSMRYDQRVDIDNIPLGKGITGAAAQSREIVRVGDTSADPRYIASHVDIRSEIAVPLVLRDRVIGVMDLESDRPNYFTEEHARTLSLLAPQIAKSLENARLYEELAQREQRLEQDLNAARELQRVILPRKAPEIEGLDIAIGFRPAREVSGDIYDFFGHDSGHTVIAFGDSSGKGAAAALYGALVGGLLRTLAPRNRGPASLMQAVNAALVERRVDAHFVTLLVLLWHVRTRRFTMANAGAAPPLVWRKGEVLKPRVEGVPLGLLEAREYEEIEFQAECGDLVVLHSDGITDQLDPSGADYGRGRLVRLLKGIPEESPQAIVNAIFADVDRFTDTAPRFDDQTLIVMKVI